MMIEGIRDYFNNKITVRTRQSNIEYKKFQGFIIKK